jgi:dihydroxy-acid dehydratase
MGPPLRSREWFAGDRETAVLHRAALRAQGHAIAADGSRPVIGVTGAASDLNPCHAPLVELIEAVKRGVRGAGGVPVEFPTISLGEDLMKPSAMLYRNLMAIDVEESLRAHPIDGVVLLANCDKTIPAQLMAAASANLPAIMVTGGPREPAVFRGRRVGSGTDLWRYWEEHRAGRLDEREWQALEACLGCSVGACNTMGTASTMAALGEALGMVPAGSSTLAAGDSRRLGIAERAGRRAVELVHEDVRPASLLTANAFENAAVTLAALGGSTNAIIHLCAIAGRRGIALPVDTLAALTAGVPVLADVEPIGSGLFQDLHAAGGVPALMGRVRERLHDDALTIGGPLAAVLDAAPVPPATGPIRSPGDPVAPRAFAFLRGSLAPDGAVLKIAAADPALLRHRGPALVFRDYEDMLARTDDPDLDVPPETVLVLPGCGPRGVPGMPEWGMVPIPKRLAARGVRDMVRISDGRMSGTSFGTVVLHVAPEAAAGGAIGLLRDGDMVSLDALEGRLDVEVSEAELAERRRQAPQRAPRHVRGWPRLYAEHVLPAPAGCDLDFLHAPGPEYLPFVPPVVGRS